MTGAEDVVETLVRLKAPDRDWILERLSPGERAQLALKLDRQTNTAAHPEPVAEASSAPLPDAHTKAQQQRHNRAMDILASAQSGVIAALLKKEPAWIVNALLQEHQWPWEQSVLASLPSDTRYEMTRLKQTGVRISHAATEALIRIAGEKLGGVQAEASAPSKFENVLGSMRQAFARKPLFGMGRR